MGRVVSTFDSSLPFSFPLDQILVAEESNGYSSVMSILDVLVGTRNLLWTVMLIALLL